VEEQKKTEEIFFRENVLLSKLVEYQEGAVVSRTLIKKDTGTITVFAFDKGQALSEHTAPFDAFVLILEGEAVVTVSGVAREMKRGEMTILPAGKPHSVTAGEKFKMLLVMIKS
jgi:quercetin dioxygenase-like cupin family protein